ncbi:MAG: PepSY domain-containing protein [Geminocystis sp. GBBB08]|nr:PepSY domain-containing protein [Geminocystis sp. GBBB08]
MDTKTLRKLHRKFAPIVFLPLFITAFTGVFYRVARSWFGASDEFGEMILFIHQGEFLGKDLRVFYVLLNGLGLIAMVATGIIMSGIFRPRKKVIEKVNQE